MGANWGLSSSSTFLFGTFHPDGVDKEHGQTEHGSRQHRTIETLEGPKATLLRVGHVEMIFYELNVKWWLQNFSLVSNQKKFKNLDVFWKVIQT